MALIAAHLAKVGLEHTTGNAVVAHVGKEAIRQSARRARRSSLKLTKSQRTAKPPSSARGFTARSVRISTKGQARSAGMRSSFAARGASSFASRGGMGSAGGFGGFHGK